MVSVNVVGAQVVPIFLVVLLTVIGENSVSSIRIDTELSKQINESFINKELRAKVAYFIEHYPLNTNGTKTKGTMRRIDARGKKHGANRGFWGSLGCVLTIGFACGPSKEEILTAEAKRKKEKHCDEVCKCGIEEVCYPVQCPALPEAPDQCAPMPECHPLCHLHMIAPLEVSTTRPPTTSSPIIAHSKSTTTKQPKSSSPTRKTSSPAPKKLTNKPSHATTRAPKSGTSVPKTSTVKPQNVDRSDNSSEKTPGENKIREDQVSSLECCMKCMEPKEQIPSVPHLPAGGEAPRRKYRFMGEYYLDRSLENRKLNQTDKKDLMNVYSDVNMDKVDPKLIEAMDAILKHFGDQQVSPDLKKDGKRHNRKQELIDIRQAGAAVSGHILRHQNLKDERKECGCPNILCPILDLKQCEGRCPNKPGCYSSQCVCTNSQPKRDEEKNNT